jgi:hypothetical protein
MTEERKKQLAILAAVIGALAVLVMLFLFLSGGDDGMTQETDLPTQETTRPEDQTITPTIIPPTLTEPSPELTQEDPSDRYLRQLARDFVERIASYSNQNNNQHIDDVLPLATDRMGTYIQTLAAEQSNQYQGIRSVVISSSLLEKQDTSAIVELLVRQETRTATTIDGKNRKATVDLVRQQGTWKVDGLFWQE